MKTKNYLVKFTGRQLGAIGICYKHTIYVCAMNKKEAENKLYRWYEQIANINIKKV